MTYRDLPDDAPAPSRSQVEKLGKKIRSDGATCDLKDRLVEFRDYRALLLAFAYSSVAHAISGTGCFSLISGRIKRIKAIERKLMRPSANPPSLWNMGDIVGLRVLVEDVAEQDAIVRAVERKLRVHKVSDLRWKRNGNYRSVHCYVKAHRQLFEIQVRTIPQHLWAEESESFGEAVKEGGGLPEVRHYLRSLSCTIEEFELVGKLTKREIDSELARTRAPISVRLNSLNNLFQTSKQDRWLGSSDLYLLVFDRNQDQLTQSLEFSIDEMPFALSEMQRISNLVDEGRFDVVLLNSLSEQELGITHSRFFPHVTGFLIES